MRGLSRICIIAPPPPTLWTCSSQPHPRTPTPACLPPAPYPLSSTPIVAVRADIGRLPFATGSVDAIHAGAAIHCWPNPQAAMAEISRVLRPGGVLVASTFLTPFAPLGELVGDATIRPISQVGACVESVCQEGEVGGGQRYVRVVGCTGLSLAGLTHQRVAVGDA